MIRVVLFLCVNLLVILLFGSIISLFGYSLYDILITMGIFGSLISLYFAKFIALSIVNGKIIKKPCNGDEKWLLSTVYNQSNILQIVAPQLAIYHSSRVNSFATGSNKNNSLIAISTGLLKNMSKSSIEAVIAHEMYHIVKGDMITMTLIQGMLNIFIFIISHSIARLFLYYWSVCHEHCVENSEYICFDNNDKDNINNTVIYVIIISVLELIFGIFASLIVLWFSRYREFYADAGSAKLVGVNKMIIALKELHYNNRYCNDNSVMVSNNLKKLYIISHFDNDKYNLNDFLNNLFSSHPTIKRRIEALKNGTYSNEYSIFLSKKH